MIVNLCVGPLNSAWQLRGVAWKACQFLLFKCECKKWSSRVDFGLSWWMKPEVHEKPPPSFQDSRALLPRSSSWSKWVWTWEMTNEAPIKCNQQWQRAAWMSDMHDYHDCDSFYGQNRLKVNRRAEQWTHTTPHGYSISDFLLLYLLIWPWFTCLA